MAHFTIAVNRQSTFNNLLQLGKTVRLDEDTTVDIVVEPTINVIDTGYDIACDIFLTDIAGGTMPYGSITMLRYPKYQQQVRIGLASKTADYVHLRPIPTWSALLSTTKATNHLNIDLADGNIVIVKPNGGANGVGQFEVDISKVPLRLFLSDLRTNTPKQSDVSNLTDKLDKFVKTYNGHVKLLDMSSHGDSGGIRNYSFDGACVQRKIKFNREYRVIKAYNGSLYIFNRLHGENGRPNDDGTSYMPFFASCIGGIAKDKDDNKLSGFDDSWLNELIMLSDDPIIDHMMGSMDVWVDDESSTWGVFEYQVQHGDADVEAKYSKLYIMESLRNIVKEYVAKPGYMRDIYRAVVK